MPELERPKEEKWSWAQPEAPFPACPGCNGGFVAPSGMGKTTTIVAMILGPYKSIFEEIYVFSPSVSIDNAWDPVKTHAKRLKNSGFYHEWDEKSLQDIMERQRRRVEALKAEKTRRDLPQVLVIVDDFADDPRLMRSTKNALMSLYLRGRHSGFSIWTATQKLSALSPTARANFRFMLVWRLRAKLELDKLFSELSAVYPIKALEEMYWQAIEDSKHSFWYVNLSAPRTDMFHIRFNEVQEYVED